MSHIFSFSRLAKLITKQFFENSKMYGYAVLALFGLLSLVFAFYLSVGSPNYREEESYIIFIFGLFITGTIFSSMAFNMLGSKDKGIYWLSIPATHLEKLVCTIFYTTIVFTAVYCVCFYLVKLFAVLIIKGFMQTDPQISYTEMSGFDQGFGEVLPYFICGYFAVQALYLLGSVYFSRFTFIMTSVVCAVVLFAFAFYINRLDNILSEPSEWNFVSVKKFNPVVKGEYYLYSISPTIASILKYLCLYAFVPVFWIITWYRLKEKEI